MKAVILAIVFGWCAGYLIFEVAASIKEGLEERDLIEQCERNLPRDQKCEIVKSARVVGGPK